jgi:hypothetical protein
VRQLSRAFIANESNYLEWRKAIELRAALLGHQQDVAGAANAASELIALDNAWREWLEGFQAQRGAIAAIKHAHSREQRLAKRRANWRRAQLAKGRGNHVAV